MDQTKRYDDILSEAGLIRAMSGSGRLPRISVYASIDSTNAEAKRILLSGETQPTLVVAEHQTAGRGRMGRSFYSPAHTGAYFSVAYTTQKPPESVVTLTGATAVAVMRAIYRLCGIRVGIKWVNDLYLDGKKICGILAESMFGAWDDGRQGVVIGIGINLNTHEFPKELMEKAGSLDVPSLTREALIVAVWQELMPLLETPEDRSWLADYRTCSTVLGKEICWLENGEERQGFAESIDEDGALMVRDAGGGMTGLFTGEISLRTDGAWK